MLQIEDNKNEFLAEQLELLRAKQKPDSDVEWEDICALRTSYDGSVEHRETIRKGSKLLYEYLSSGWVNPPSDTVDTSQIDDKIQELQKDVGHWLTSPFRIDRSCAGSPQYPFLKVTFLW